MSIIAVIQEIMMIEMKVYLCLLQMKLDDTYNFICWSQNMKLSCCDGKLGLLRFGHWGN